YTPTQFEEFEMLAAEVQALPRELHLPLLELALPALDQLSPDQYTAFLSQVRALADADERLSLFEWCLYRILRHQLEARPTPRGTLSVAGAARESAVLLSVLAAVGHTDVAA